MGRVKGRGIGLGRSGRTVTSSPPGSPVVSDLMPGCRSARTATGTEMLTMPDIVSDHRKCACPGGMSVSDPAAPK